MSNSREKLLALRRPLRGRFLRKLVRAHVKFMREVARTALRRARAHVKFMREVARTELRRERAHVKFM